MENHERVDDIAYGDRALRGLDIETRMLFERTLTAIGVPPSMRHRGRLNLKLKFSEEGVGAIEALLGRSRLAAVAIEAYLKDRRVSRCETAELP